MFVNSDQAGLKQFAEDYGVKVSVVGPTDYDVAGQAAALDQVVATNPGRNYGNRHGIFVEGFY